LNEAANWRLISGFRRKQEARRNLRPAVLDNNSAFPSFCSKLNIIKRPSKDNRSATAYLAGGVPISPDWEVLPARPL
jgi:hypothetical protein